MTDIATTTDMTAEEGARLLELERMVEMAMRAAGRKMGEALREIRDRRLYRASHSNFDAYLLDRHGLSHSAAYRMMDPPKAVDAVAAIGRASARAAQRRHETLDQPPVTVDPEPEPLEPAPEKPEEPRKEPGPPLAPVSRLIPPSSLPAAPPPPVRPGVVPGPERSTKIHSRDHLNRLMNLIDAVDATKLAEVATQGERKRIAAFALPFADKERQARIRGDEEIDPKTCPHPANRLLGDTCGRCGAKKKAAK